MYMAVARNTGGHERGYSTGWVRRDNPAHFQERIFAKLKLIFM